MVSNEIWKDIKGYEGLYQVSNLGNVKSIGRTVEHNKGHKIVKERILKSGYCGVKRNYLQVQLQNHRKVKSCKVHRLVAEAFIPNPNNYSEINHIDENPSNNCVDNLEWCDRKYNNHYGTRDERARKSLSKMVRCLETNAIFDSTMEAQRKLGVSNSSISMCARGKYKTAGGYHWQYV